MMRPIKTKLTILKTKQKKPKDIKNKIRLNITI